MKRIATLLASIFLVLALQAQEVETHATIYLHSGVVVRGTILSQDNNRVTIQGNNSQVSTYSMDDVESISTEEVAIEPEIIKQRKKEENKKKREENKKKREEEKRANKNTLYGKGFRGFVETGFGFGINNTHNTYDLSVAGGYRFSKRFYLGFGLGLNFPLTDNRVNYESEKYTRGWKEGIEDSKIDNIYIYAEPHLYLGKMTPKTKTIPYFGARLGVNLDNHIQESLIYFALSFNVQQQLKNRHSLIFSLAYNLYGGDMHCNSYYYKNWYSWNRFDWNGESYYKNLQTISIRVAYGF